jgi:AraC-like DNA-binding protein
MRPGRGATLPQADTISAAMVLRTVRLLEARGAPVERLLEAAGLTRAELSARGARVAYASSDRLLELSAEALGANGLGLELALTADDESYGAAGLLLVTASTFRLGLERSLAYQRLWGDGERFNLVDVASHCAVRFRHPGPSALAAAVATECALCEILAGARALVDTEAVPLAVELTHHALGDPGPLEQYLRLRPRFGQPVSRIVLATELVDRPMRAVKELLSAVLQRQAERALALLPQRDSCAARVRPLLAGEDGLGRSLDEVAQALRLSGRTLQRRLRREGTSFQALLDEARRERTTELESLGVPGKEIAFRLGFQDASAFSRARRRWRT